MSTEPVRKEVPSDGVRFYAVTALLALLAAEWFWRRWFGLA